VDETRQKLAAMWTELLKCDEVADDSDFFVCGGTSITAVHLAARIQGTLGVPVDAVEVVVAKDFGKIADLVQSRLAAAAS
jgi:hypothetical protein